MTVFCVLYCSSVVVSKNLKVWGKSVGDEWFGNSVGGLEECKSCRISFPRCSSTLVNTTGVFQIFISVPWAQIRFLSDKKKKKSRTFLWNQSNSFPLQPRSPSEQLVSRTFGGSSRSFHGQHRHKAASCTSVMPSLWLSLTCEAAYSWMTFLWGFFCRR